MPYRPDGERPEETPLTEAEQKQCLKDLQSEQARTLRDALGDTLYDWLESFDDDLDVFYLEKDANPDV